MSLLPVVASETRRLQLPISPAGGGELLAVLLQDRGPDRVAGWQEVLAIEPGLVLWAVLVDPVWRDRPPDCLEDVARRVDETGPNFLSRDPSADVPQSPAVCEAAAAAARRSLEVAHRAADCARAAGAAAEPVWLMGLLHNSDAWLELAAACGGDPPGEAAVPAGPGWLIAWQDGLRAIAAGTELPAPETAAAWVAAALAASGEASGSPVAERTASGPEEILPGVDRGRFSGRWSPGVSLRPDLLGRLSRRLLRLEQLEQDFQKTLEREKLESLKMLAYGASHEINNPLANISTRAQTLLRGEEDPERRHKLAVINSQAFRAHEMIADMMLFARPPQLQREPVELTGLIDTVLGELQAEAAQQATRLERVSPDRPILVLADETYLAVALKAICTNALEALQGGGRVEVGCGLVEPADPGEDPASTVAIRVRDTGPGIPPEARRHLFDPYYSGREAGRGLGLGLSKAWRLITDHGGRIEVESREGQGATFTILLTREACPETPTAR